MKLSTRIWYGLGMGVALLPAAMAGPAGETGEAGEGGETGATGQSMFPGDLDKAITNIFGGEGGEGGAGLTPMWPSVVAPALTGADVEKVVTGNTLRTDGHVAWYFAPDRSIEGGFVEWKATGQENCPAQEDPKDVFYRGLDGVCYTYKLYSSSGNWSVRDNQLCLDVRWETGVKADCRYVTILLDDIALFDATGKIDGKGMKLLKGKSLAP